MAFLRKNASKMIIEEYLDRFRGCLNHIKFKRMNSIKFSHELTKLINLQESVYITAYRTGYTDDKSLFIWNNEVVKKIKDIYFTFVTKTNDK